MVNSVLTRYDSPSAFSLHHLKAVLRAKGIDDQDEGNRLTLRTPKGTLYHIQYGIAPLRSDEVASSAGGLPSAPESLCIARVGQGPGQTLLLYGTDQRGLAYALYEAARAIELGGSDEEPFLAIDEVVETPELTIRSAIRTMMNRDLDVAWLHSQPFWADYLDMLVATRHNRLKLSIGWRSVYFSPPYPYLVEVPGFEQVTVTNVSPDERTLNLAMLQSISTMAKERGLEFYLDTYWLSHRAMGDWAEARRYIVEGVTDETLPAYTRAGIEALLKACPNIDGIGLSGSMVENGVTQELMNAFFDGIAACGRQMSVQIELKGVNQELVNSALERGIHVTLGGKYCMEHKGLPYHPTQIRSEELGETRDLLAIHTSGRRWTRNSYADMLYQPRRHDFMFNLWNWGTQKVLLWGDAEDVARLARNSKIAGSLGLEHGDPLTYKGSYSSGPAGAWSIFVDPTFESGRWEYERYWLHYLLYGRLMYNTRASATLWRREFVHRFGEKAAHPLITALALASKTTPLMTTVHAPSASDNSYWPEIYTNIPITSPDPMRRDGGSTFGECSPSDSALFYRIDDYVRTLLQKRRISRYTPAQVAAWFLNIGEMALDALAEAQAVVSDPHSPEFRATSIDITIQAQLALFFAHKLEAATQFGFYRESGDYASLLRAIAAYEQALHHWREIVSITLGVYQPNLAFHRNSTMSGSWADREQAIVVDLGQMEMFKHNFLTHYATGAVTFAHVPVTVQHPPQMQVETTIKGWERVQRAQLHYRLKGENSYTPVPLEQDRETPPLFKASWPVPQAATNLDYYLEAFLVSGESITFPLGGAAQPLVLRVAERSSLPRCTHTPPASFEAGKALTITCQVQSTTPIQDVWLHYRHVNQAELIQTQEMALVGGSYQAVIPADYTDSRYAMMYYFTVNDQLNSCTLYPGLESELDAPYFVIDQIVHNQQS